MMQFCSPFTRWLQLSHLKLFQQHDFRRQAQYSIEQNFDTLVNKTLARWHTPGLAIAVVEGDHTWSKGYGISSFPDEPVTPSTLFYTGSTTKAFTAAAMSLLVDNNLNYSNVQWTTPLSQLIRDDFVLPDEYATTHITIEDALSHRTGLPSNDLFPSDSSTPGEIVRSFRYLPLNRELRTTWQYCNIMYIAVSHVIEVLTGEWLGDVLRRRIWEPLDMRSTFFSLDDALQQSRSLSNRSLARGYYWHNKTSSYEELPWLNFPGISGAGSVISNVVDYSKWLRAVINRSGPISESRWAEMLGAHAIIGDVIPSASPLLYGFGWISAVYHGEQLVFHNGAIGGYGTDVMLLPNRKWGVVTMSNTISPPHQILAWQLLDDYLEIPLTERFDWETAFEKAETFQKQLLDILPFILYPYVPSPPLPLTLPLESYVGTYHHPAYQDITFVIDSGTDACGSRLNATVSSIFRFTIDLRHVSGEYFLAYLSIVKLAPGYARPVRAEFKIDASGQVSAFGAELGVEEGGIEGKKIWFNRVE